MGDTALGSDLSDTEDELMADDMAAVAESATEEMAGDVYELESISLDELPNFIRNALEQGATTIPSADSARSTMLNCSQRSYSTRSSLWWQE